MSEIVRMYVGKRNDIVRQYNNEIELLLYVIEDCMILGVQQSRSKMQNVTKFSFALSSVACDFTPLNPSNTTVVSCDSRDFSSNSNLLHQMSDLRRVKKRVWLEIFQHGSTQINSANRLSNIVSCNYVSELPQQRTIKNVSHTKTLITGQIKFIQ